MSDINVKVISNSRPNEPLTFIGQCAGTSTAKSGTNDAKRALSCLRMGHTSVFEHVSVTFHIEGISRNCSHQLVRHRLASFTQESQRYHKLDVSDDDWYVTPPEIAGDENANAFYCDEMRRAANAYTALLGNGYKAEDARFVLPTATKTTIVVTMNLRELASFWGLRSDKHAQWEIRELAYEMRAALLDGADDEWEMLIDALMPLPK